MSARAGLAVADGRDGSVFYVHVVPRGCRDEVIGLYGQALKIRLKAPPIQGKANDALRAFLAQILGVSRDDVVILSGRSSRHKHVRVTGVKPERIRALVSP